MLVRFGYVAHATSLWDSSPAKTMTFKRWQTLEKEERQQKMYAITKQNITNTKRALFYNIAHGIPLYRISSTIVPLATHREVEFDYISLFDKEWKELGEIVKNHNLRVSFHPGQFTLFTSDKETITQNAVTDMTYHYNVLKAMGLEEESMLNIHVGGAYGNKAKAIERFHENIQLLPIPIKKQMTLENDDKTYTAEETLAVCEKENIPLVFDYHHHLANRSNEILENMLPRIFNTWQHIKLIPKVHISSPKSEKEFRSHAEYVDMTFVQPFFEIAKTCKLDFDVMVESKAKDKAMLQLVEELSKLRGYKRIDGGVLEIK
ncbi:UV DNA damage repair endonuclease UvsE [Priestia taiwanensis]|uniref:UV DNA damage endonuclease n=1 Tax=Priestia taiwanensis TaxID=1347902 RepID=A0A917AY11_9BACI|nr:UV DNA damage repair endonuclease UvsE [Priestia taiwanensis]MBM7364960.1 UV DNA damage endonuclease [Priestia taiwanensis]GGE82196.1 UV DNA damage endonuclease [Priestia taiwanensis]